MPVAAKEHDAHTTTNDGRTLKWAYNLRNHIDKPMTTSARADLPLPWWVWVGGIVCLLLTGLLVVWAIRLAANRNRTA